MSSAKKHDPITKGLQSLEVVELASAYKKGDLKTANDLLESAITHDPQTA